MGMEIRLFGRFRVLEEGTEHALPPSSHAQLLLSYLCLNEGKAHTRSELAALLRPDAPEQIARRILNQALWHIRRYFPNLLSCTPAEVALSKTIALDIDVSKFRNLTHPYLKGKSDPLNSVHDLQQAVELYQGDLLEGVYEDWVLLEREYLRENYLQVLTHLIQLHKVSKQFEQALSLAIHLTKIDPLREGAHREVMRLYNLLGNPQTALNYYNEFRIYLRNELDLDPEPEMVGLAREIARRSQITMSPYLPDPPNLSGDSPLEKEAVALPMIGRSMEKETLLMVLEPLFQRQPVFVILSGEPGIGKTRMIQEIQAEISWRGAQVLYEKTAEGETGFGGNPLLRAIKTGLSPLRVDQIKTLVPPHHAQLLDWVLGQLLVKQSKAEELKSDDMPDSRKAYTQGLILLLKLWSEVSPLLIVLEDMHWANQDTWELLAELIGKLHGDMASGIAFLSSIRPEEAGEQAHILSAIKELQARIPLNRLDLRPLDREATGELVRLYMGIRQPYLLLEDRVYQETGGNPLFILESLRLLYQQSKLARGPLGDWQVDFPKDLQTPGITPISRTIEKILSGRIARLPQHTQYILQCAAILGDWCEFSWLKVVCQLTPSNLLAGLQELVQYHFLAETDQGYTFRHDHLRQSAYASLSETQRISLHAHAGNALEILQPEQVQILAFHFHQGQVLDQALVYYQKAGKSARKAQHFHQAAYLFSQALSLVSKIGCTAEEEFQLLLYHESVLDILGQRDEQKQDLQMMGHLLKRNILDPNFQLEYRFRYANWLYQTGQYADAEAIARQAYDLAEKVCDVHARAQALDAIGSALHGAGKDAQAVPYLRSAIAYLQAGEDLQAESKTWQTLAVIYADSSQYDLAMQAVSTSTAMNRKLENHSALAMDLFLTSHIHLCLRELTLAEQFCHEAVQQSQMTGNKLIEAAALSVKVEILYQQGRIGEAVDTGRQALAICQSLGEEKLQISILNDLINLMLLEVGDLDAGEKYLRESMRLAIKHNLEREIAFCLGYQSWIEIYHNNLASARRLSEKGLKMMQPQNSPESEIWLRRLQARVELSANRPGDALKFLDEADLQYHLFHTISCEPELLAERSEALLRLGRKEEALQAARRANSLVKPGLNHMYAIFYTYYQVLQACGEDEAAFDQLSQAVMMLNQVLASIPCSQQGLSRENVPLHRQILQAWETLQPKQIKVSLPLRTAGVIRDSGQGGDRNEVEITWTVWLAQDSQIRDKVARRRSQVIRLLAEAARQGAEPGQRDLAEALGVSLRTIAQDMAKLRASANR